MDRSQKLKLNIVIVGGGLGGLSAAIACALAGHNVVVLESVPALAEIGAGLQITPNSSRILERYGIGPGLADCWTEPTVYAIHRYSDGKLLLCSENWDVKMRERYGAPFVDVHRGQLQLLLYNRALALGVDIQLGATVQSVNHEIGEVFLDTGKSYRGDLVVGADGLWSVCRKSLLQEQVLPQPTGDLAYRITLTLDQVSDSELRNMIQNAACHLWIGPNSHVVAYSMKAGTMYNIVLLVPDDLPPHVAKQSGDIDEMRALFRDWDPLLSRFLNHVDSVQKWKLMHLPELETWRNGKGNFILLGDSCHPMLPYLAQGANSAIEDGAVLGAILSAVTSSSQIAQATEIWQSLRKQRSEFLVNESYEQRTAFHMVDGPQQEERDRIFEESFGKEPGEGFPSRWADSKVQKYIFGYDAYSEASTATALLGKTSQSVQ